MDRIRVLLIGGAAVLVLFLAYLFAPGAEPANAAGAEGKSTHADEAAFVEICPACGEPVECGMRNGDETCWCFALPPALPMLREESAARCYCRKCLQKLIDIIEQLRRQKRSRIEAECLRNWYALWGRWRRSPKGLGLFIPRQSCLLAQAREPGACT
jgi:hypothetical protein